MENGRNVGGKEQMEYGLNAYLDKLTPKALEKLMQEENNSDIMNFEEDFDEFDEFEDVPDGFKRDFDGLEQEFDGEFDELDEDYGLEDEPDFEDWDDIENLDDTDWLTEDSDEPEKPKDMSDNIEFCFENGSDFDFEEELDF